VLTPRVAYAETTPGGSRLGWALGYTFLPARGRRPALEARVFRATGDFGTTHSHHDPGTDVVLSPSASVTAVMITATFGDEWRVGIGPSQTRMRINDALALNNGSAGATTHRGLVVEAAVRAPARTRFFVELGGQYRRTGILRSRYYEVQDSLTDEWHTVPAMRLPYNHVAVGLSIGMRL